MSEDAMIERTAREEQDELDRAHGQHILDLTDRGRVEDPVLKVLRKAHQAEVDEQ